LIGLIALFFIGYLVRELKDLYFDGEA
jgi:hypothetical protein